MLVYNAIPYASASTIKDSTNFDHPLPLYESQLFRSTLIRSFVKSGFDVKSYKRFISGARKGENVLKTKLISITS